MTAALTPLLQPGTPPPGNSFVLWDHKLVYVSITKVANTSLRWMIADLAGEDPERFYRAPGNHVSRIMTIHANRRTWQHATTIGAVPADRRAEISRDNGWFVFVLVRDPWARLWSAWSSKMLVQHGDYLRNYGARAWFPRVPEHASDLLEDWYRFVDARPWESDPQLSADPHFMTQVAKVRPTQVNYTRIYDLSEMPVLLDDLRAHLDTVGRAKELYLPRANETPVPMLAEALDNGVADAVRDSFRADFEAFPQFADRWTPPTGGVAVADVGAAALRTIAVQAEAYRRLDDMYLRLGQALQTVAAQRGQLAEARRKVAALEGGAAALPAAARRPSRSALGAALARSPQPVRRIVRRVRASVSGGSGAAGRRGPSS